jgi:hypothetical protein
VIERYRHLSIPKFFRGDAAFAIPELYAFLEAEHFSYTIRLKSHAGMEFERNLLEREIAH